MLYEVTYHSGNFDYKNTYELAEKTTEELKPKVLKTLNEKDNIVFAIVKGKKVAIPVEYIDSVTIKKVKSK